MTINLKKLDDDALLELQKRIKDEMASRRAPMLIKYLKKYWEENKDNFNSIDLTKLEKTAEQDLGIPPEDLLDRIHDAKIHAVKIPARSESYRKIVIYWK